MSYRRRNETGKGPKMPSIAIIRKLCLRFFVQQQKGVRFTISEQERALRKKLRDASYDDIEMGIDISLVFFNTTYP